MPSGHTILRGFSEQLDLRPLHFIVPPSPDRVCSACGHVCKRTGALLCGHLLCGLCYQQCGPCAVRTCPFDGEPCPEESVEWREFPAEQLLKKQVNCWNKANGCSATIPASDLSRHFHRECEHHLTSCPKCSTNVLCKSLCSHIRSCAGSQRPSSPDTSSCPSADQQSAGPTLAVLSTATPDMQQQLDELKTEHKRISLQELSLDVKNLEKMLKQDVEKIASESRDNFSRHAADIELVKDKVAETGKEVVEKVEVVLRHTMKQSTHEWILKGYASLKDEATRQGVSESQSDPVYLCGYFLLLGVYMQKTWFNNSLSLNLHMCLGKGEVDEYLQWPFQRKISLSVVHPEKRQKREVKCGPSAAKYFSRPMTAWNQRCCFTNGIQLSFVECEGYVKDDQLQLCFALL